MLTDAKIGQAKAETKAYALRDGNGLYVEEKPTGVKVWRIKCRYQGKDVLLTLGRYPSLTLLSARRLVLDIKDAIAQGIDPRTIFSDKKSEAEQIPSEYLFSTTAENWFTMNARVWSESHIVTVRARLDNYILPVFGQKHIGAIPPTDILAELRKLESRGVYETAKRVLGVLSMIFRLAVASGLIKGDPCRDLRGALAPTEKNNFSAITNLEGVRALMRAIDCYQGSFIVKCALYFTAFTFVRQGEIRYMTWDEVNFDDALWTIPAERMKMRRSHVVPLSTQALAILRDLQSITGGKNFVFSGHKAGRPISENTICCALRSMGFAKEQMSAHGFRSMASTLLNEEGFRFDVIERQLAHVQGNSVRAVYNRAEYLTERKEMMQWYADFLTSLVQP